MLCRKENGHGYTFHPEFANYVNKTAQMIKRSPEATFYEMVQEYGGQERGEFSYIFWILLPGYLAMRKYFEMLRRPIEGAPSREEVAEYFYERGADNWTKDQWVEFMTTEMPKDEVFSEIADIAKADSWTNTDRWDEIGTMAQIVYAKLVDEGKNLAKLIE